MKKILIVDDEPTLVATLKYNLERENYQVATASDGEGALSEARSGAPVRASLRAPSPSDAVATW